MPYRAPRFAYVHAIRDVGISAIDLDGDTAHADFPVDNLIDDRGSTLFKFSTSVTDPKIEVDLGASFDTGLNRLILPANHNISSCRVNADDEDTFTAPDSLTAVLSPTPGTLFAVDMTASTKRYIRLAIVGTLQYQLPQLIFSKTVTFTAGPNLENSTDQYRDNVTRITQPSGLTPTVQHGPQQREIEYVWDSPLQSTDLTAMEALVAAVGMSKAFYLDPHSFSATPDTADPPIAVKFAQMPRSAHSVLVPMSGAASKTYAIQLIESVD